MKIEKQLAARTLRVSGHSVRDITSRLDVSKGSVSRWVRDIPQPIRFTPEARAERRALRIRRIREEREQRRKDRLARKILGSGGHVLMRTPHDYRGSTLSRGCYVYEHRYLMEKKLGRILMQGEVVHHINEDPADNKLDNLELKIRAVHSADHGRRRGRAVVELRCPACKKVFIRVRRLTHLVRGGKRTFCSRRCSGYFGKLNHVTEPEVGNVIREFRQRSPMI